MKKIVLLYIVVILLFSQGLISELTNPILAKSIIEFFFFLFVISNAYTSIVFYNKNLIGVGIIYLSYFIWVGISTLNNDESIVSLYKYVRFSFYSFLVLVITSSMEKNTILIENYIRFFYLMIVVQCFAALLNIPIYGRIERVVGTISNSGGALGTIFPIFAVPYFFAQYYYSSKKRWLLLSLFILIIGYSTLKRAVFFFFPLVVLFTYAYLVFKGKNELRIKHLLSIPLVIIVVGAFVYIGMRNVNSLRSESNNSPKEQFSFAYKYAQTYSYNFTEKRQATGRMSANKNIIANFFKDEEINIFGNGPSTLMGNSVYKRYNILYGISGWGRELISVGLIGFILLLSYFLYIYRIFTKQGNCSSNSPLLNSFRVGTLIGFLVLLLDFFFYSQTFVSGFMPLLLLLINVGLLIDLNKE